MRALEIISKTLTPKAPSALQLDDVQRHWGDQIERRILESGAAIGLLGEMIHYHLASGGKRLRALLPVWTCANLGGCAEDALDLGVGLELMHNATLVHDDLQDGDHFRRGCATVWHRWGAAQAINVGDALVFQGFLRISHAPVGSSALAAVCKALIRTAEGQAMDLALRLGQDRPAAADADTVERSGAYGVNLGTPFQLQDDLLDLVGKKGREFRGSDLVEGKPSFPVVWAYEHADPLAVASLRRVVEGKREEKTRAMVEDAIVLLAQTGALAATATCLKAARDAALNDPMADVVPGLVERILAPVAHALSSTVEDRNA